MWGLSRSSDLRPFTRRVLVLLAVLLAAPHALANQEILEVAAQDPANGFTMMIATFQRDALLPTLLQHLTTSPPPSLRHIVLIWQNIGVPLPDFLLPDMLAELSATSGVTVSVRMSRKNSMNERFRPYVDWGKPVLTEAVMIMDDDVVLRRDALEWGYQQFRIVNPPGSSPKDGRIVGFTGRDYVYSPDDGSLQYSIIPKEGYSMVLSNAAWFRREWLEMYWADDDAMSGLRDYIDEVFNCDDLLINFLVSNFTHLPPLLLQPSTPLRTIPSKGLWNRGLVPAHKTNDTAATTTSTADPAAPTKLNHFQTRPICLQHFFDHYASPSNPDPKSGYPLVKTDTSVSQDITDHARWMAVGESWEAPTYYVPGPEDYEDDDEDAGLFDEESEAREFEAMLEKMSQDELAEYVQELEEAQELDEAAIADAEAEAESEAEDEHLDRFIDEL